LTAARGPGDPRPLLLLLLLLVPLLLLLVLLLLLLLPAPLLPLEPVPSLEGAGPRRNTAGALVGDSSVNSKLPRPPR
jgi:hypothetical protein